MTRPITNEAEARFAAQLSAAGKNYVYQPTKFPLPLPWRSYRPDFYVPEDDRYYEVVGSRQALSQNREKIHALKVHYPTVKLLLIRDPEDYSDDVEFQGAAETLRRIRGNEQSRIAQVRVACGLTQAALAQKAGVSGTYITMLETGARKNPSLDLLKRLAKALGVSIADLVE